MPFPLLWPDRKIKNALDDPTLAHRNMLKQHSARRLYCQKFREAEIILRGKGLLKGTFAEVLESPASKIYACFSKLGDIPEQGTDHIREMVRLAFGVDDKGIDWYLSSIQSRISSN